MSFKFQHLVAISSEWLYSQCHAIKRNKLPGPRTCTVAHLLTLKDDYTQQLSWFFFFKMLLRINTCAFLLVTIASVCLLVEFENTWILLEAATGCPTVRYYLHRQVGGTWSELSMQSFLFVRSYGRSECEKLDSVCCAGFVTMFSCDHLVSGCIWFWRLVAESRCLPLRFVGAGLAFLL